jgi:probable rRNA maturation factor
MSGKNKLSLAVQYPDRRLQARLTRAKLRRWVQAALFAPAELTIRLVDAAEGRALNHDYRNKDSATNVLTFAYDDGAPAPAPGRDEKTAPETEPTRADIVLCSDVLEAEAAQQNKTLEQHAAHLVVHGVLHAQGYDHDDDSQASEMEALETAILARLGIADPYLEESSGTAKDR